MLYQLSYSRVVRMLAEDRAAEERLPGPAHRLIPSGREGYGGGMARPSEAPTPTRIAQKGPRGLLIEWSDGVDHVYDVRDLRLACGCAVCVDEWSGEARLDASSVPEDVHPLHIKVVGRYALHFDWSDGHDSGIYPFARLRGLGEGDAARRPGP
ncbi:MAG: DUF971 domain-containing protein [Myxococcota bacterium]